MLKNKNSYFIISMIFGAGAFALWAIHWYTVPQSKYHLSILWPIGCNLIQATALKIYLIIDKKDLK